MCLSCSSDHEMIIKSIKADSDFSNLEGNVKGIVLRNLNDQTVTGYDFDMNGIKIRYELYELGQHQILLGIL